MIIYTLHEGSLDFTACTPFFIQYTGDHFFAVLESDEINDEINLYDDFDDNPDRTQFFTSGEHPRGYVEGCKIPDQ
jgi:hypothetical protein